MGEWGLWISPLVQSRRDSYFCVWGRTKKVNRLPGSRALARIWYANILILEFQPPDCISQVFPNTCKSIVLSWWSSTNCWFKDHSLLICRNFLLFCRVIAAQHIRCLDQGLEWKGTGQAREKNSIKLSLERAGMMVEQVGLLTSMQPTRVRSLTSQIVPWAHQE